MATRCPRAWRVAAAGALAGVLVGCAPRVGQLDAEEFSYPPLRKARAKLNEGDREAALALVCRALDAKPTLAQAHLEAAQLYDNYFRDYARAIYHYERYLDLRPQTEKREMIEGFLRQDKIAFAAAIQEQFPGTDKKLLALQEETMRLRRQVTQLRANLAAAQRSQPATAPAAAAAPSATPEPASPAAAPERPPAAAAAPPVVAAPAAEGRRYRAVRGDTLSRIAARMYQDPRQWTRIRDANRALLAGGERVREGQVLVIPK